MDLAVTEKQYPIFNATSSLRAFPPIRNISCDLNEACFCVSSMFIQILYECAVQVHWVGYKFVTHIFSDLSGETATNLKK